MGVADLTERYWKNQRQNRLSDSSVPFHNFKLKRPQRGGLASHPIHHPWIRPCTDAMNRDILVSSLFCKVSEEWEVAFTYCSTL